MIFEQHAIDQMNDRGILRSDAEAVVRNPDKIEPGYDSRTNFWGYGPVCGYRIRVTVNADGTVKTVAWADNRKGQ